MKPARMTATMTIDAPPDAVFAVLADPAAHAAIDGTSWVREPLDAAQLTETGQIFRMAMYHHNHPDKDYEMANRVEVIERPRMIACQPGRSHPRPASTGSVAGCGATTSTRVHRRRRP